MILHIARKNCTDEISDLPFLEFYGCEVCVRSLYAELESSVTDKYITLTTNMVPRTIMNQKQECLSFYNSNFFETKIYYKPTRPIWYPVELYRLDDCTIKLLIEDTEINLIKNFHLQLEFRE